MTSFAKVRLHECQWCHKVKNSDEMARGDVCVRCGEAICEAYELLRTAG